jgi:WD40 repeat protein
MCAAHTCRLIPQQHHEAAAIRDRDTVSVAAAGHSKRVTAAVWGQDSLLITGSNDKTLRFWKHTPAEGEGDAAAAGAFGGSWACAATATEHEAEIRGLALHPSRVYGVSVSADASWAWWDLAEAKCLKQVRLMHLIWFSQGPSQAVCMQAALTRVLRNSRDTVSTSWSQLHECLV